MQACVWTRVNLARALSTREHGSLVTVCQLASSLWQQAGFHVPTPSPPPVWSLKASLGPCREGLLGGQRVTVHQHVRRKREQTSASCSVDVRRDRTVEPMDVCPSVHLSVRRPICILNDGLCLWRCGFHSCQVKKRGDTVLSSRARASSAA